MIHYFFVILFLLPWTLLGITLVILGKLINPGGKISHQLGRVWALGILKTSRMKLSVNGMEKIDPKQQYIFVANHTSAFDIPAVYWGVKNKQGMLAKKQLLYVPFFGWAMWAAGHFFVDRKDHKRAMAVMDQVAALMSRDRTHSLVIFPEGTRSLDGQVKAFKKGAFILSLNTGIPIVPIVIKGAFEAKQKNANRIQATTIQLDIHDPVDPGQYSHDTRRQFVEDVHILFEQDLNQK
ncbi:MAG: 1-acyl-sn-glycerol-3-phosphate acyltransferase [Candidatus Marinimicrobia bacterium]|nr:1-acyl-sn-glycerol-3-phosphate acyltransferase [Candidatus Neomarinimicrobiota bacterium]MCF7850485.1 1-acyl-sn-glycerol-3-phosphate acyltransferase [Candidatus Neomarinimicrobiota bacterium]MCF7905368.1 1-acyl-sn-glycerol-3-phosphate acyltransferase [Candidatus Neomarinimicrobiota bacterium]